LSAEVESGKLIGGTKELAALLGVTGQRVRDYVNDGMPTLISGRNKKYNLSEAFYWYVDNVAKVHSLDKDVADEENKLASIEEQIQEEKLEKLQLDNAKTKREYVPIDEMDTNMAEVFAMLLSMLKQLNRTLPIDLENKSRTEIKKTTDSLFEEAIKELKKSLIELNELE